MTEPLRINLEADQVGKGLSHLVLAVLEVLEELLERQAVRRLDAGDLDESQIEALGRALMNTRRELDRLRAVICVGEPKPVAHHMAPSEPTEEIRKERS